VRTERDPRPSLVGEVWKFSETFAMDRRARVFSLGGLEVPFDLIGGVTLESKRVGSADARYTKWWLSLELGPRPEPRVGTDLPAGAGSPYRNSPITTVPELELPRGDARTLYASDLELEVLAAAEAVAGELRVPLFDMCGRTPAVRVPEELGQSLRQRLLMGTRDRIREAPPSATLSEQEADGVLTLRWQRKALGRWLGSVGLSLSGDAIVRDGGDGARQLGPSDLLILRMPIYPHREPHADHLQLLARTGVMVLGFDSEAEALRVRYLIESFVGAGPAV
jgi:hypothetical protein